MKAWHAGILPVACGSVVIHRHKQERSAPRYRKKQSLERLPMSAEYHRSVLLNALHRLEARLETHATEDNLFGAKA